MPPSPATPDFSRALPDRPIAVRPPPTIAPLSTLGLFALLLGLLGSALWWLGPDLARDWGIGGDVVRAEGARIEEAQCRSRIRFFTVCDIAVIDERSAPAARRTLSYLFIDTAGREPIVLVRPRSDATAITTDLGLDKFYHRLLALALVVGLLVFCIVVSMQFLQRGIATRRALMALSGQRLSPVVVALEGSFPIAHKRRRWTYVYEAGGREERAFIELASSAEPLFVRLDGKRALALRGQDGGVPLLLDAELAALDLTQAEKAAFFAACRKALGQEPSG